MLLMPVLGHAETVYVIDRLLLGVHESPELKSAIIKVLPTATALEILERSGAFARVRTEDGVTGWVDTDYLMSEQPAQLLAAELEAQRRELEASLADARARIQELENGSAGEPDLPPVASDALRDLQRLAEENRFLKEQLAGAAAAAADVASPASETNPGRAPPALSIEALADWQWILAGSLLLLAFGLGAYAVDYSVRRRHGGFRV